MTTLIVLELGLRSSETIRSQAKEKAHLQKQGVTKIDIDLPVFTGFKIAESIADSFELAYSLG